VRQHPAALPLANVKDRLVARVNVQVDVVPQVLGDFRWDAVYEGQEAPAQERQELGIFNRTGPGTAVALQT